MVGLMQFLPALLLTLPAGQLVDRVDRRGVLAASLVLQALVAIVLMWASLHDSLGRDLIFGASVLLGVARALQMPAQQAIVPALVPPDAIAARVRAELHVAQGRDHRRPGARRIHLCERCRGRLRDLPRAAGGRHRRTWRRSGAFQCRRRQEPVSFASLFAGVGFIWRKPAVLGAISLDLFAVLLGGATALLPIYAKDILHTGPWGLGLLRAAPSVGALVVGIVLAHTPLARHVGRRMFISVAIYGVAIIVFGLSHDFMLSMVALAVSGGADMVSVVIRQTLVQLDTPDDMRGRVSAVNGTFIGASNELGEFRAGTVAEWLGPVGAVIVGGVGTLIVAGLWMRWFPSLARRDHIVARAVDTRTRNRRKARTSCGVSCSSCGFDLRTMAPPCAPQQQRNADDRQRFPRPPSRSRRDAAPAAAGPGRAARRETAAAAPGRSARAPDRRECAPCIRGW